ncbi:MAG: mitochondrial fission ELM1 family protein [Acetobacteraceae bacterium]|nr:mitochondrial fission ELM1 family protein [Acetobacteraceae bacterium]
MTGTEPVWVLEDPRAGTAAQALGIAERLGLPFRRVMLRYGRLAALPFPWPTLAGLATPRGFGPPWPRLAISAGRRAAPVSRWLRRKGVRTVHAMRPGFGARDFDLLVLGRHDEPRPAPNVLPILGAMHRLSPARLSEARAEWTGLAAHRAPRVALLVGGPPGGQDMPEAEAAALVPAILRAVPDAAILCTTSRRTGAAATAVLARELRGARHRLYAWGDGGPNPLLGFLAWADAVVVTADSVSMLSEALSTAVPVFVAGEAAGRHAKLLGSMYEAGQALPLARADLTFRRTPLDETGRVAAEIRSRGWV